MVFHESSELQKQWALHSTGVLGAQIARRLRARGQLRVDWFNAEDTGNGRLGITLLPGRRDHRRDLELDIEALKEDGVTHVVPLLTNEELWDYGVSELMEKYGEVGVAVRRLPILDQGTSSVRQMNELLDWIDERLEEGAKVLVHCVGGLGRAGLVGASYLRRRGMTADAAIAEVRRVRSPRALESAVQEEFVQKF
jgi:protein-tyrosine phosphatase